MEKQNMTLSLPKALLKKAKALAASKEKSLSVLLKESLEDKINEATGYNQARDRQMGILKRGINLGTKGRITISREELHAG